ncbi:hypothetical protein ACFL6A_04375, partial [bacterium]
AYPQEEILDIPYKGFIYAGTNLTMWKVGAGWSNAITQVTVPMMAVIPINSRLNVTIMNSPSVTWGYVEEETILGLSDTWVKGNYVFWNKKAMFHLGLGLPTGKTRLTDDQYEISKNNLSRNVFRYQLPVYGQGFCGRIGLSTAHQIRDGIVLGMGVQYLRRSTYHPVTYEYSYEGPSGPVTQTWDVEYRPGDELGGNIGVDIRLNENVKILLDGVYTYYGRDLLDGKEVFGSGNKINVNLGIYWQFGQRYLWSHLLYRRRGKNELLQGLDIQKEAQILSGDQYELDIIFQAAKYNNGALYITGEARYYTKNELYTGPDLVSGLGIRIDFKIAQSTIIDFRFKYQSGNVKFDENRSVTGLVTFIGFRYDL